MTGMDTIKAIRRQGFKPQSVFVQLVETARQVQPLGHTGVVTVQIGQSEVLSDLDFWPLVGLMVCVEDLVSNPKRHHELAVLISKAKPETLWMPEVEGDSFALHIRRDGNPPTSTTYEL